MQGGVLYESHPLVPTIDFDEGGLGWCHAANPTVPPTTQGLHRTRSGRSSAFRCLRCYRTFLGRGLRIPASRSFRFWCPARPDICHGWLSGSGISHGWRAYPDRPAKTAHKMPRSCRNATPWRNQCPTAAMPGPVAAAPGAQHRFRARIWTCMVSAKPQSRHDNGISSDQNVPKAVFSISGQRELDFQLRIAPPYSLKWKNMCMRPRLRCHVQQAGKHGGRGSAGQDGQSRVCPSGAG